MAVEFTPMDPVTGISLGRIALGLGALASPTTTAALVGLDPEHNPQLSYWGRMFGAREIALGAITLVARGSLRRNLTVVGIAVDGADAATGLLELSGDNVPKLTSGMLIGVALGAVAGGVLGLARGVRPRSTEA